MNRQNHQKKSWTKPTVHVLIIKKDTFSGSTLEPEGQGGSTQVPINPTPR